MYFELNIPFYEIAFLFILLPPDLSIQNRQINVLRKIDPGRLRKSESLGALNSIYVCMCILGCFSKDTLKKNKNPTPARNWGAPRKNISRRRGWSNKSRGSLKALEVWQNSRRRPRQCFWMWKVLFLLPPSAVQAEDDGCSENLFSRETAGETLEWRLSYPLVLSAAHSPLQREENDAETQ